MSSFLLLLFSTSESQHSGLSGLKPSTLFSLLVLSLSRGKARPLEKAALQQVFHSHKALSLSSWRISQFKVKRLKGGGGGSSFYTHFGVRCVGGSASGGGGGVTTMMKFAELSRDTKLLLRAFQKSPFPLRFPRCCCLSSRLTTFGRK